MPTPNHTPRGSRTTLPPRLTVPPFPPQLYRQLLLTVEKDGVLIRPQHPTGGDDEDDVRTDGTTGVLIKWGAKGKVETWDGEGKPDDEEGVVLGGILGIVRLWDAAYLLAFLRPTTQPFPLFPNHVDPSRPESSEDDRAASASTHQVYTLKDIHAIPLLPDLAEKSVRYLSKLEDKRRPRRRKNTMRSRTPWNLFGGIRGPGSVAPEDTKGESSDEESSDEEESDDEHLPSAAPEADETPEPEPAPAETVTDPRKRFSRGWGSFMSRSSKETPTSSPSKLDKPKHTRAPSAEVIDKASTPEPANAATTSAPFASDPPQRRELETKILKQIISEFSAGTFFYSFDFDLTHSLQHKRQLISSRSATGNALANLLTDETSTFPPSPSEILPTPASPTPSSMSKDDFIEPDIHVPLWRRADHRFFWNEWLCKDFIDLGLHGYIIPVMQGWVQSASFTVPIPPNPLEPTVDLGSVPVDINVISRRSRDRAGLRYQRRGIDDQGHVANFVETEMIVRAKISLSLFQIVMSADRQVEGKVSLFSFVQIRGSIPLKWSQSPYSMKPPPVLDQPVDKTFSIADLHFTDITSRYGPTTIVNLSEQTGKEGIVTNGYRDLVKELARPDVVYKDFDFHAKCKGMNWENISELVKELDFNDMGYLWTLQGDSIREQKGVFRTNCIDCLDRTNVVQSALARHVLSTMLTQLGLVVAGSTVESVFNDVWANNGDTISLCYAHTSALKGDFVRTGKRDLHGMLHDGVSSLSRMFYGAVSDFFAQAVISFFLGHRNLGVFSEFLQNLQSSDASSLIQLSRVRSAAIETSSARVLGEGEQRIAGWTLLSPEDRNIKLSPKLEEKVLLLSKVAIYVVSFNYTLEKVVGFTRIPLRSITSIQKGAYILSPLQEAGRDPLENSGFIINFSPHDEQTRYSTYSIRNKGSEPPVTPTTPSTPLPSVEHADINPLSSEYYAFKVLPREFITRGASTVNDDDLDDADISEVGDTCRAVTERAVKRISDQCAKVNEVDDGFVVDKDVVSVSEAQSSTGLLARVDYAVKRFLWL